MIRSGWRRVVAYRLTDAARGPGAAARPNPSLAGNDKAIMVCNELAVGPSELADLLNAGSAAAPGDPPVADP